MIAGLTAAEIAKVAFEAVIGKLTETALKQGLTLWGKIKEKLQGEKTVQAVLVEAEKTKSEDIIQQQVVPFLQVEMIKDPQFAQEIQALAQQVININNSQTSKQTQIEKQINKDIKQQFNIQNVEGGLNLNLPPE